MEHSGGSTWGDSWIPGLGLMHGSVTQLEGGRLKVPHVGWDQLHLTDKGRMCPLFADVPEGANVYFTHSFAVDDDAPAELVATRTHYLRSFPSAVWEGNVFGVQFHPEKSAGVGMAILRSFLEVVRG
jgi:glutamine amidotransferase